MISGDIFASVNDYWQQKADYSIEVIIDDSSRTIMGRERLYYGNNSPDSLKAMYFRCAANSFQPGSPLVEGDSRRGRDRIGSAKPSDYGYTSIKSFKAGGENLEYVEDYSIIKVELAEPIAPGEERVFEIEFVTKLPSPKIAYRLSDMNGQYKAAHWYPQVCVYDRVLGWVNNQYLGWGENYGEVGNFDVSIDIPAEYIVAATGVLDNEEEVFPDSLKKLLSIKNFQGGNSVQSDSPLGKRKNWKFRAENVCDFVFAADDNFCYDEMEYDGIRIKVYPQRENADEWTDAAETGRKGIQFYSEYFGRYAYPQMSITDSWSGMEYPMLVMCSGRSPEYYLLFWHEIGHNYFMGAVASNQTDRAFLDEGFTTFLEIAAMEHYLGRADNLNRRQGWLKQKFYPFDEDRVYRGFRPYMQAAKEGFARPMPVNSDKASEWMVYRVSSYYKPVCMLFAMEYMFGREKLFRCIKEYYENWKFKHPYETDMFRSFEESSDSELNWFFEEWVYTDKILDYAVGKPDLISDDGGKFRYYIWVERKGEMIMPLRVKAELDDGSEVNYWIPLNDNAAPDSSFVILPLWDQIRDAGEIYYADITVNSGIKNLDLDPESLLADMYPMNNRWPWPKVRFDWKVEQNYVPVNAYHVRHRPDAGYNDYDGLDLGWQLEGGYLGYKDKIRFEFKVGTLNGKVDFKAGYETPLKAVGNRVFGLVNCFSEDGYQGGQIGLRWIDKPNFGDDAKGGLKLVWEQTRHLEDRYLNYAEFWDKGADNTFTAHYWRYLDNTGNDVVETRIRASAFTEDFSYSRWDWKLSKEINIHGDWSFNFEYGGGWVQGDKIPGQRKFYQSGWDLESDRENEYIGVRGFFPHRIRENFSTNFFPGVYTLNSFRYGERSFSAAGLQFSAPPRVLIKIPVPILDYFRGTFFPIAFTNMVFDIDQPGFVKDYVYEAGVGIKAVDTPAGDALLVFPVWVEPALPGEDNFDFRWYAVIRPKIDWWF